jgi:hypothetical protein
VRAVERLQSGSSLWTGNVKLKFTVKLAVGGSL